MLMKTRLIPETGLSPRSKIWVTPSEWLSSDVVLRFLTAPIKLDFFLSLGMGNFFRDLKFFQDTEQNRGICLF